MHRTAGESGFTLIELLVVLGIISALAAALLLSLGSAQQTAHRKIDAITLHRLYAHFVMAHQDGKPLPPNGGHEFVYYPWVSGAIERTPENLEAHFVTDSLSPRLAAMLARDTRTVLTSYDRITSADTDYAGRSAEHYSRRMFHSGFEPLLATDNESGNTYPDGSVLVLYGNGVVRTVTREQIAEARGDPDYVIEVGAGSPVADLRKLAK